MIETLSKVKATAVIVAAGQGERLRLDVPKAFVPVGGTAMLQYSLRTVAKVAAVHEAVIAVPPGAEARARAEVMSAGLEIPVKITPGGAERQDSVWLALKLVSAESEIVVVHDAARPFAAAALFEACLNGARDSGAAIAALPIDDTLKRAQDGAIVATVARAGLLRAQTPQAFRRELLARAHECAARDNFRATDDAELVERLGVKIAIVEGSPLAFKITTPTDLAFAQALARASAPGV